MGLVTPPMHPLAGLLTNTQTLLRYQVPITKSFLHLALNKLMRNKVLRNFGMNISST